MFAKFKARRKARRVEKKCKSLILTYHPQLEKEAEEWFKGVYRHEYPYTKLAQTILVRSKYGVNRDA